MHLPTYPPTLNQGQSRFSTMSAPACASRSKTEVTAVTEIDITPVAGPCAGLSGGNAVLWEMLPGNPLFLLHDYFGSSGLMPKWLGPLNLCMMSSNTGLERFEGGMWIGPSCNWMGNFSDRHYFLHHRTRQPVWPPSSFMGFRAEIGGIKVYGYVELTWDPHEEIFEILAAAYDPSGDPIRTPMDL